MTDSSGCSNAVVFTGQTVYCNGTAAATTTRTVVVPAPAVTKLSVSPRNFSAAGRKVHGRCVTATRKNKHRAKCTRLVSVYKTVVDPRVAGSHSFSFTGKLAAGTYELTATPAGGTSLMVTFRVVG